jgi:hypothetical protein
MLPPIWSASRTTCLIMYRTELQDWCVQFTTDPSHYSSSLTVGDRAGNLERENWCFLRCLILLCTVTGDVIRIARILHGAQDWP